MSIGLTEIGIVVVVCLITASTTLFALNYWFRERSAPQADTDNVVAIRFLRGRMVEADPAMVGILRHRGWDGSPNSLRAYFSFRFKGLPKSFVDDEGEFEIQYAARRDDDTARLRLTRRKNVLSIVLLHGPTASPVEDHVRQYQKYSQWLAKWVSRASPNPIWVADSSNEVIWGNRAYWKLAQDLGVSDDTQTSLLDRLEPMRSFPDREQRRYRMSFEGGRPDCWIDVTVLEQDDKRLHHAVDVSAVVQAENAQRTFVQTLTKTFAQLSTGLAIFDRTRRLALFNPALVDMTGLSAEFLSSRPGYLSFFDRLREGDIMPEPRSYANWRKKLFDLISSAEDGRYQETWALSSGQTYRVTGRPHPNGAVAFLIEDISAEVTLTRRFREQLDMSQAVVEALDEAVAVFSPRGRLSYTNAAYRELWGDPEGKSSLDMTVGEASRHWQTKCEASPVWGDFRDFVVGFEERADWDAAVHLRDGGTIDCRFRPLNGGATLAIFRRVADMRQIEYQGFG